MASISNDPNGRRRILFIGADQKRRVIRLGKVSQRFAVSVKVKVEDLVSASITGHTPADETARWLANLDSDLYNKLARVDLARQQSATLLGAFINGYIAHRSDVKPSTHLVYSRVRRYLVDYFGEEKPLRDITAGDADNWRLNLQGRGLAENTVRRSCGVAKQWFTSAVRLKLIPDNPFTDLAAVVKANTKRFFYINREQAQAVLNACPDAEWRLLFALARYGGLRVPSEVLQLRWQDIDWSRERFTVTSPKTEHHDGHGSRLVPLFPELQPHLRACFEQAEPGAEFCITRYRHRGVNLRTQLQRIIKRAGMQPWPKLWQNLRSTRETELADEFPAHVASAWIGNSVAVAMKHYLQVTDEHFQQAAQKAAQQLPETPRKDMKLISGDEPTEPVTSNSFRILRMDSTPCEEQEAVCNGRYRTRTCDLTGVIRAL